MEVSITMALILQAVWCLDFVCKSSILVTVHTYKVSKYVVKLSYQRHGHLIAVQQIMINKYVVSQSNSL